jgi:hypothetical protein
MTHSPGIKRGSIFPIIGNFSKGWKNGFQRLFTALAVLLAGPLGAQQTQTVSHTDAGCIEACALLEQQSRGANDVGSWDALTAFTNAPGLSLELFSQNGASLYIKGSAPTLSDALLAGTPKAAQLYRTMQQQPAGSDFFYSWNDESDGLNRTDISWMRCGSITTQPIIVITRTHPYLHNANAPLAGSWVGAFTEKQWTAESDQPRKSAGQMNALFLPLDTTFFFRFYGQGFAIQGHGLNLHNRLSAISTPETDTSPIYWYMDANLETTKGSTVIRGSLTGTFNQTLLERKFYLRRMPTNAPTTLQGDS